MTYRIYFVLYCSRVFDQYIIYIYIYTCSLFIVPTVLLSSLMMFFEAAFDQVSQGLVIVAAAPSGLGSTEQEHKQ